MPDRTPESPASEGPGSRIGPYKLLQQIGEGGFGVVFLAEQERPVVRRVALKIIKLGMDTRQVIARFEQERQALAVMDHPNIARVLDAGATETGRPYFVMDLVKGDPIGEYCDKHELTIEERLDVFAQVCSAVQHAHVKGIIHRDLKPSNVLVSTQDGRPLAKVIDFGIAKATSSKLTEKTLVTEMDQVIGTLEYMSPEQAEGSLDIDTRTDVYALGVILYELLAGSPPFDVKALRSAMYSEAQRIIREVDPPRPSTRLAESREMLASIAALRRVEPQRLGAILRGELDWIVMKALEKDRARRYESASALAEDVRRYLDGEAVVAAPPSAGYRLRKFVRRHRGGVAGAAAVLAALLLGVAGFAWQAHRAGEQRDRAIEAREGEKQERDKAERLAKSEAEQRAAAERSEEKAQAINDFLLEMLNAANIRALGRDAKVADVLGSASEELEKAFGDRPEVSAAVHRMLGSTYLSIGLLDEAEPHVKSALELDRSRGENTEEYARSLKNLSFLQSLRGDYAVSLSTMERALAIAEKTAGPESAFTLAARGDYANTLSELDRYEEAIAILEDILEIRSRLFGRGSRDSQIVMNSLAVALHHLKRLDEAEALYREALDVGVRRRGPDDPDTLISRMNLASLLVSRGRLAEAEPMMVEVQKGAARVFGDSNLKTADAAKTLGRLYERLGRYADALPCFEEAVAIYRRVQGDETRESARVKDYLATVLERLGETERAESILREVEATYERLGGPDDPDTLMTRKQLAELYASQDRFDEARALYERVIEAGRRTIGEDSQLTYTAVQGLGVLFMREDRFAEAEPYIRASLETGRRLDGADHMNTLIAETNLAGVFRETGRLDEAVASLKSIAERADRLFGDRHATVSSIHATLSDALERQGRAEEAVAERRKAIAIGKAALGPRHAGPAWDGVRLARLLVDAGDAAGAEPLIEESLAVLAEANGGVDARTRRVGIARVERGRCRARLGRFAEAAAELAAGHAILVELRPPDPAEIARAERALAELYERWNAAEPNPARAARAAEWKTKADAEPK